MAKRLLFVVNVDWFFLSHRLPLALEAARRGFEVHVAVGITDRLEEMRSHGFVVHPLSLRREGVGVADEPRMLVELVRLFRRVRPDLVHLVTIRPVLYGGIAARLTGVPGTVAAISGLGHVFVSNGLAARLRRAAVGRMYRLALGGERGVVIFQNEHDMACLTRLARLPVSRCELVRGSGADLGLFVSTPLPHGTPTVLMASRLIKAKGVWEFVEAARLVRERGVACRFLLAGDIDPGNPTSLTRADLARLKSQGLVEVLGPRRDMPALMAEAHAVVLPSYYGEGVPRVLIEAAASGRAIVTTDMPGCRDAVWPGVSGLLVPPRDPASLAEAITRLVSDRDRCERMGLAGRRLAEERFDLAQVVARHMDIYERLLQAGGAGSGRAS